MRSRFRTGVLRDGLRAQRTSRNNKTDSHPSSLYVGDTGQRETGDADSWLRKRGRSTDFTGCVQIEKSGTLLFL